MPFIERPFRVLRTLWRCSTRVYLENSYPFRNVGPVPSPVIFIFIVYG